MQQLIDFTQHHWQLVSLTAVVVAALLVYELRLRGSQGSSVSPQDAVRLMNQGATVFDVRSSEEFGTGHIRGAKHLADAANASASFPKLRERVVLVCCAQGMRSAAAVRSLTSQGFTKVFNLRGGLKAWGEANLPLTRE